MTDLPAADPQAAAERIRNYLRLLPDTVNLGAESAYSPTFRTDGWPQDWYPLTREDIETLLNEQDGLLAELDGRDEEARERWITRQEEQLGIKWAEFRAGRWEMDLASGREFVAAYVAAARAMLGDAPNYSETRLEFDVKIAESPEVYTLVVQRHGPGVMTPHEARQKAERERDEAQAVVARVRDAVMNQSATVDLTQAILDALGGTQQADDDTEGGAS